MEPTRAVRQFRHAAIPCDAKLNAETSILIIANPRSGGGRAARLARDLSERLAARRIRADVRFTESAGDGERIARDACHKPSPPRCIVACGGDGTIQQVAHVLATSRAELGDACPTLGVAPAGRCNDFARALGIPRDADALAELLASGASRPLDLGRANGRHFCTVATAGIDAEISDYVDRMRMPLKGTPAYLYGALRVLARYQPRGLRIEGDFGVIDRPVFLASSANTSSYGGAVPIAPMAIPDDGALDLCVIPFMSKWKALAMIPGILRGRHATNPAVTFARFRRLRIEAPSPLELWADGERIATTPAEIEVVSKAVRAILPA